MHLKTGYQINTGNTHVAQNLHLTMQSTLPGVLTGENCTGLGKIIGAQYLPLFWSSFWVHIISADKSIEIQFI